MSDQIITVGDLKLVLGIIAMATQRGSVWSADDLTRVGALYDKMAAIVTAAEEKAKAADDQNTGS